MEHHKAMTSDLTTIDSNNNNNSHHHHHHHHHNRRKKRTTKQQQLVSSSLSKKPKVKSLTYTDPNTNQENIIVRDYQQQISMKNPLSWKKRWSKWLTSCSSERTSQLKSNSITVTIKKRSRTKSENDLSKRGSTDQDEKKNLSTFAINPNSNENQDRNLSKTFSHQHHHHHHQSIDKVNNSNSVIYRDASRRYSNPFFSSTRYGGGVGQHQSRTSITALPSTTNISQDTHQKHQPQQLSRSADRLNSKSSRRELRYEEHTDYIPPPSLLNSIQCHPTIDHYARNLNQSSYFCSTHRRSQIEVYQLSSPNRNYILPRPYSSNIPITHSRTLTTIPITYSSTINNIKRMSQTSLDNNETYGKLSDCHSPLTPVENSSVKAPRRIEPTYSQFPTTQQEPVYANTQSLYDNILYPESSITTTKIFNRNEKIEQEKKSCASQTQLTWTMATFSSFVDLENQSVIIQPDPATLFSFVRHHPNEPPPSASPSTIEQMKRMSPNLQYIDDNTSVSRYQQPRTPTPSKMLMIEKRDGSFQTLLTIAPTEDLDTNKHLNPNDSTPSPLSTGSSSTTDHHHHHHHHNHRHRRHKSRSNTSRSNISTRDVGLQVNIQTVKKITFSSEKSDESSLTTSTSSPPTVKSLREFKNIQTTTEPSIIKHDRSTSYETNVHMITSSSQTLDSPTNSDRQTKAAQTPTKSLRDQAIETNNRGLFVCDLSSFLKNGVEDTSITITKQKS